MRPPCPECGAAVTGAPRKIYCSSPCRNKGWLNRRRAGRLDAFTSDQLVGAMAAAGVPMQVSDKVLDVLMGE